jgi:hypothetical protein
MRSIALMVYSGHRIYTLIAVVFTLTLFIGNFLSNYRLANCYP